MDSNKQVLLKSIHSKPVFNVQYKINIGMIKRGKTD